MFRAVSALGTPRALARVAGLGHAVCVVARSPAAGAAAEEEKAERRFLTAVSAAGPARASVRAR